MDNNDTEKLNSQQTGSISFQKWQKQWRDYENDQFMKSLNKDTRTQNGYYSFVDLCERHASCGGKVGPNTDCE